MCWYQDAVTGRFRRAINGFTDSFGVFFQLIILLWTLTMGAGFLFYLLQWPVLFYGALALAVALPSLVIVRRENRSLEGPQNVSKQRSEQALERFIEGVKRE